MNQQNIELRVHAGAPSSRKDDDRYKSQLEAYLAFQAVSLDIQQEERGGNDDEASIEIARACQDETSIFRHSSTMFLDDTQLAWSALDSQLNTSSLAIPREVISESIASNRQHSKASESINPNEAVAGRPKESHECANPTCLFSSPNNKRKSNAVEDEQEHVVEHPMASEIVAADLDQTTSVDENSWSSYLKSPALDRSNKKQRLDSNANHPHKFAQVRDKSILYKSTSVAVARIGDPPPPSTEPANIGRSESLHNSNLTSELPTSYSLSDITSESSRAGAKRALSQRTSSEVVIRTSMSPNATRVDFGVARREKCGNESTSRPRAASNGAVPAISATSGKTSEPPPNRSTSFGVEGPDSTLCRNVKTNTRSTIDPYNAGCSQDKSMPQGPRVDAADLPKNMSYEIQPPPSTASESKYFSHVTDALNLLADHPDLSTAYSPVSAARELCLLERGYWLVDCTSSAFPLQTQVKFWECLKQTIAGGHAGWGVWCSRDAAEQGNNHAGHSLGVVKLFCWGEVVLHTYLLLYVASASKVRKLGLQWIDAEEKVVVQMKSAEPSAVATTINR